MSRSAVSGEHLAIAAHLLLVSLSSKPSSSCFRSGALADRHRRQRRRRDAGAWAAARRRGHCVRAGYQGAAKREENQRPEVKWYVALRPSKRKLLPKNKLGQLTEHIS